MRILNDLPDAPCPLRWLLSSHMTVMTRIKPLMATIKTCPTRCTWRWCVWWMNTQCLMSSRVILLFKSSCALRIISFTVTWFINLFSVCRDTFCITILWLPLQDIGWDKYAKSSSWIQRSKVMRNIVPGNHGNGSDWHTFVHIIMRVWRPFSDSWSLYPSIRETYRYRQLYRAVWSWCVQ